MTESIGLTSMTAFLDTISNIAFIQDINSKRAGLGEGEEEDVKLATTLIILFWFCICAQAVCSATVIFAFAKERNETQENITFRFEWKRTAMWSLVLDILLEFVILVVSGLLFYQFDMETIASFLLLIFGSVFMIHVGTYEA